MKIFLFLNAVMYGFWGLSPVEPIPSAKTTSISASLPDVKVGVRLGRASRNCRGLGICEVYAETDAVSGENTAQATLRVTKDTEIVLLFQKTSMSDATLNVHFASGEFKLEEDVKISPSILSPRDAASGQATGKRFVLRKGTYTIEKMNNAYKVVFEDVLLSSQ